MSFLKNIYFRAILGLKMTCRHNFGSTLRIFLKLCTIKRSQEVHGNYINGFSEKNCHLEQMGHSRSNCGTQS